MTRRGTRGGTERVMTFLLGLLAVLGALGIVAATASLRVVKQYERGVVFRLGRVLPKLWAPGRLLVPIVDRLQKVNMQIITLPVPARTASPATTSPSGSTPSSTSRWWTLRGGGGRPGLPRGDRAGRADLAAVHHRQERPRRPAVRPREAQPGPGADDRQPGCGVGCAHRPRRDQGRLPARDDEALDGAAGRGRPGAPRPGHQRRRRTPGVREARRRPPR